MTVSDDDPRVVDCDVANGIATITLDSQHNRNALSRQLLRDVHRSLDCLLYTSDAADDTVLV